MSTWVLAWSELKHRRGRTLLTLSSVVIAVAAIVAVTSATATTRKSYQQIFAVLAGRTDLEVVARGGGRFRQEVMQDLREVAGVRAIVPVFHRATNLYAHGAKARVLAVGILPEEPESTVGLQLVDGKFPTAPGEVALEANLAESLHLKVGEQLRALSARGLKAQTLTGTWRTNDASRVQQGGMLLATVSSLQSMFRTPGEVDGLHVFLDDPKQAEQVMLAAAEVLPTELRVQFPKARSGLAEEMLQLTEVSLNMASALSFTTAVVIALSVFLMNVSERRRQIAILRAIGATRGQVMGMICREALVVGFLATLFGIPLGLYGGGFLLQSIGAMMQTSMPSRGELSLAVLAAGCSGPLICLVAAWIPARRASRVSPLEGMRPVVTVPSAGIGRRGPWAGLIGLSITGVVTVLCMLGLLPIWIAILGMVLSLLSVTLLVPVALRPAVALVTWPWRGRETLEGQMSKRLVLRHAGRSALTVGVLLIAVAAGVGTSNAVFSVTDDTRHWYERTITADFLLRAAMPDMSGQDHAGMDAALGNELAQIDGVERVEATNLLRAEAGGAEAILAARDFRLYDRLPLNIVGEDSDRILKQVLAGDLVLGSVLAERLDLKIGDSLEVIVGDRSRRFQIAGIVNEYTFGGAVVVVDRTAAAELLPKETVDGYLIKVTPGTEQAVNDRLESIATEQGLLLQTFSEVSRMIDSMVAGVTGGLWALLLLGLGVGALGVVNTLSISVLEQTRELGMLRAVGMRRNQVMRTILGQALLMGTLGILGGGALGMLLARMMNICLITLLGRPVEFGMRLHFVALLLAAALTVVMISALIPARRAAQLSPIEATRVE